MSNIQVSTSPETNEHYESANHRGDNTSFDEVQKGNAKW